MSELLADARFAVRGLAKRKGWSALLVATLAMGIAANAVIFDVMDAMLVRAFDFANLPRLVRVYETSPSFDVLDLSNVAAGNFLDWRDQTSPVFEELVALEWWDANLRGEPSAELVQGQRVSPGFFEALGVRPLQGRSFARDEARPGFDRRVVLGHDLWQRSFGGRAGLVGTAVWIDAEPYQVVGIAPAGFRFPEGSELWAPLTLPAAALAPRDVHRLSVFGLLAQGRSRADAGATLALVTQRLEREHPRTNTERAAQVVEFSSGFGDPVLPQILAIWQAAALLVLLIGCVNAANLILARGAERQRELALRLALGASRARVVRQLLTEGLVVSLLAAALSAPLVALAARAMRENMPAEIVRFLPGWDQLGLDARTLLFSAVLAVLATALFSAVPALRSTRPDLTETLREGGRSSTAGTGRQRARNLLVVAQVAGALVLVASAGLSLRSASAFLHGPQGFEPRGLLSLELSLSDSRYPDPDRRREFTRDALARLGELPGVDAVAVANVLPGRGAFTTRPIEIDGQAPPREGVEPPRVEARWVSAGYLDTLRLPLYRGRDFTAADSETAPPVAIVSQAMAARFWPGRDPLGERFRLASRDGDSPWLRVVGVSGDVIHHWAMRRHAPTFYQPLAQSPGRSLAFALRSGGDPEALSGSVRRAIATLDPDQPASGIMSLSRAIRQSTIGLQYVAAIMAVFGVLALLLAVSGVYGVISYRVSLRTLEIGLRVALGASPRDVLRLTLGQALRLSGLGLAIGAALAVAAGRVLSSAMRGAIAFEPALLAGLTLGLALAALVAAWIPARRALRIDPALALRSE